MAHHYELFGGVSPINGQNRALLAALEAELRAKGPALPVYWGNRNWHPFLADTLRQMARDGRKRALALVTSAYSSYSGCRQYREDVERARAEVGPRAPEVEKLRQFYNHPGFVEANADAVRAALAKLPQERRGTARLVFTAHSIPRSMAAGTTTAQLRDTGGLVAAAAAVARVGPRLPEPERVARGSPGSSRTSATTSTRLGRVGRRRGRGADRLRVGPHGGRLRPRHRGPERAAALGLGIVRAATAGTHPAFVRMIRELVVERAAGAERRALGTRGPRADPCAPDCCASGAARPVAR